MHWDTDWTNPWNGNPTRAANMAMNEAGQVLAAHPGVDTVPPSIFPPQRTPYNPGGYQFNEATPQPTDFQVWTYVYDVSGLSSVTLKWRTSKTGVVSIQNKLYADGSDVNAWNSQTMADSWDPLREITRQQQRRARPGPACQDL